MMIARGESEYGPGFMDRMNEAVALRRGVGFRHVDTEVVRPSQDIGRLAADAYRKTGGTRALGLLPGLVARATTRGVPYDEADLLSYVYFDRCFTSQLVELGREDARAQQDRLLELLGA